MGDAFGPRLQVLLGTGAAFASPPYGLHRYRGRFAVIDFQSFVLGGAAGLVLPFLAEVAWKALRQGRGTYVSMRSTRTPAQHWEARVYYDAWGAPYVPYSTFRTGAACHEQALHSDGTTSDTHLYGTQWKHLSGPPVDFSRKAPKRAFEQSERTGA
jgi:hypothetical protein